MKQNESETDIMPFFNFKLEVADALVNCGRRADHSMAKRGRPSLEENETSSSDSASKRARYQHAPSKAVIKDRFDHFAVYCDPDGKKTK